MFDILFVLRVRFVCVIIKWCVCSNSLLVNCGRVVQKERVMIPSFVLMSLMELLFNSILQLLFTGEMEVQSV